MSPTTKVYAGVDVSKGRLDVFVRWGEAREEKGELFDVPNDDAGIDELLARLEEARPALVVLEATGGFERPVAAALAAWGFAVAVLNPRRKRGTSPVPLAGSPRPTGSTLRAWPVSLGPFARCPGLFLTRKPEC